jgi:ABC-type Fe3+/spermidine/putrescine transport system ATPase subunit
MIEANGIHKSFPSGGAPGKPEGGGVAALRGAGLDIADGEFFCLLGPSGCGKTTLLRVVAGLEKPDAGTVKVGGRDVTAEPPHLRGCALVFQNYALWPHLTVGENIAYGLEVQRKPKAEVRAGLDACLRAYQLEGMESRYPHQLSGGQQQRVALARAMAVRPRALLMDEPLSNLDAALRKSLRRELLEFHRREGSTVLYVTHDQEEALALSDRMAVMMEGRIVELGKPRDLYARPRSLEAALFLGDMNAFRGEAVPAALRADGRMLCIRPENVRVREAGPGSTGPASLGKPAGNGIRGDTHLSGTLAFAEFLGTHALLGIETASGRVLARAALAEAAAWVPGTALSLEFPAEHRLWY